MILCQNQFVVAPLPICVQKSVWFCLEVFKVGLAVQLLSFLWSLMMHLRPYEELWCPFMPNRVHFHYKSCLDDTHFWWGVTTSARSWPMGCIMLKGEFCVPMSCLRWTELVPLKNDRDADDETDWSREQFPTSIPHFSVYILHAGLVSGLSLFMMSLITGSTSNYQTFIPSCCGISVSLCFWWRHLQFEQMLKSLICLGFDFNQVSSSISKSVGPKFVQLSLKNLGSVHLLENFCDFCSGYFLVAKAKVSQKWESTISSGRDWERAIYSLIFYPWVLRTSAFNFDFLEQATKIGLLGLRPRLSPHLVRCRNRILVFARS
jgi:hypothetical protein